MAEESKSEAELTQVLASEILDKIQKGEPVKYDHVRIIGNMDLKKSAEQLLAGRPGSTVRLLAGLLSST